MLTSIEWSVDLIDQEGRKQFPARNEEAYDVATRLVESEFPHAEKDPSVNPGSTMIAYRLYDIPKDVEPTILRCDMGGLLFGDKFDITIQSE